MSSILDMEQPIRCALGNASALISALGDENSVLAGAAESIYMDLNRISDLFSSALTRPADLDRDRYRRAVSMLSVLLEKVDADDTGLPVCDSLELIVNELKAAVPD